MKVLLSLLLLLVVVWNGLLVKSAIPEHEVTSFPGFNQPLPSKQYSGYISVDDTNGRYLHYMLVLSENNPTTDPLVLWLNGGPGCSSLDGYFYEQGPLHFVDQQSSSAISDPVPALKLNPWRWNKIANVLFLEAPAGVGFSFSNTASDYSTDDSKTASDNLQFLVNFFKFYPEFANNRFFVSGESYAGIYVPTLVEAIMNSNAAGKTQINLEGFMVGNGCYANTEGACSFQPTDINTEFLFGHGLYSKIVHDEVVQACGDYSSPSEDCYNALGDMGNEVGDVNIYNIYAPCINSGLNDPRKQAAIKASNMSAREVELNSRSRRVPSNALTQLLLVNKASKGVDGPVECIDGVYAGQYLNNDTVRDALHVRNLATGGTWTICTDQIDYQKTVDSLLPIYPTLINKYRVLIYNGDVDAIIPYSDNEQWTSSLGFAVDQAWHPWTVKDNDGVDQVAGFATRYKQNGFTFATVKGAGHMVPEYQPQFAFNMFERFLNKVPL